MAGLAGTGWTGFLQFVSSLFNRAPSSSSRHPAFSAVQHLVWMQKLSHFIFFNSKSPQIHPSKLVQTLRICSSIVSPPFSKVLCKFFRRIFRSRYFLVFHYFAPIYNSSHHFVNTFEVYAKLYILNISLKKFSLVLHTCCARVCWVFMDSWTVHMNSWTARTTHTLS
jgi:hypothetical protein